MSPTRRPLQAVVARRSWAGPVAVAALVLTACGTTSGTTAGPMMGGGALPGDTGYHYSATTCRAASPLPGQALPVLLADMGMTSMMGGSAPLGVHMVLRPATATVAAGKVTLVATNSGWRTHELVVLPLPGNAAAGRRTPGADGKVDETGSLGEASASCAAGAGDGIAAGAVGWTTVVLAPGRYELLCNLPNHYADGMYAQLLVT